MIKSRNKFLNTNHKTKSGIIVVILAGGLGTRLAEYTKKIPKPMVKVGGLPIIHHIILHYKKFGLTNFVIAAGYKSRIIKKYFHNKFKSIDIKVINTGLKTMTGGRIKRIKKYLNNETFLLTYGDGISSVNIKNLIKFHKKNKKLATLTAVRPPARFGAIKISKNTVKVFKEKSKIDEGWINGGFFCLEPEIIKLIKSDMTFFEKEPMEKLSKKKQLMAFKHEGFWQCMDTKRDKILIEQILRKGKK